ncbi:MAG: prenyltransferase/squalene oxidase repeat-containing protein [bacterium]
MDSVRNSILIPATNALTGFLNHAMEVKSEPIRIARAAYALLYAGVDPQGILFRKICDYLIENKYEDNSWCDPQTTAYAISVITKMHNQRYTVVNYIEWLEKSRHSSGGWGHHSRDQARIPITAIILKVVPIDSGYNDYLWIKKEWMQELGNKTQLSYKAGFYLLTALSFERNKVEDSVDKTIQHLLKDQNDDGGFAPWKNHPIGSDPWSTGVVLWGLSKWIDRVDPAVIERALHWLEVTQLPSGYWPYHYLDEGTSYALIGAVSAMRAMASRK